MTGDGFETPVIPSSTPKHHGPGSPPKKKGMHGCLVAFLVALGVVGVVFIYGIYWFASAGDQVPTASIVGPANDAFAKFEPLEDDEGVEKLLTNLFVEIDRMSRAQDLENAPEFARYFEQLGNQYGSDPDVGSLIPRDLTVVLDPTDAQGDFLFVIAVNLSGYRGLVRSVYRMMSFAADQPDSKIRRFVHADEEGIDFGDGAFAAVGTTMLIGSDVDSVKDALDRISVGETTMSPKPHLAQMRSRLTGKFDAILVAGPELFVNEGIPKETLQALGLGIDVVDEDRATGVLRVACGDPSQVPVVKDHMENRRVDLVAEFAELQLNLQYSVETLGDEVLVRYEVSGLSTAIIHAIRQAEQ